MKHAIKALALVTLSGVSMLASAANLNQYIGVLDPSSAVGLKFGHDLYGAESFTDVFRFDMGGGDTATGSTKDTNAKSIFSLTADVVLDSIALRETGSLTNLYVDSSANSFTFTGLQAGKSYELVVTGSNNPSLWGYSGNYSGTVVAKTTTVSAPVPEPAEIAITAMGLVGVAAWVRRQKRA